MSDETRAQMVADPAFNIAIDSRDDADLALVKAALPPDGVASQALARLKHRAARIYIAECQLGLARAVSMDDPAFALATRILRKEE